MKKVSCKVFFTVMWSGIRQSLGWFFGLFGYKRDGKFAKCVWGLFSISAAIIWLYLPVQPSMGFMIHFPTKFVNIIVAIMMIASTSAELSAISWTTMVTMAFLSTRKQERMY